MGSMNNMNNNSGVHQRGTGDLHALKRDKQSKGQDQALDPDFEVLTGQHGNQVRPEEMSLDPVLDSVAYGLADSVALQASGVAHDNVEDFSRESSGRFVQSGHFGHSERFEPDEHSEQRLPSLAQAHQQLQNEEQLQTHQLQQQEQQEQQLQPGQPHSHQFLLFNQPRATQQDSSRSSSDPASRSYSSNGWMNRSRFRPYFKISISGDAKIASCIYCGKEYKEGESTGNLSKHITNNHAAEYKSRERAASKDTTLTSLTSKERSLRLSPKFVSELNRESGTFASVVLITETLVPLYVVESMGWKIINGLVPDVSLIETRKAVVEKLDYYRECLNQSLKTSLESSTFLSVQLYVCSRENGLRYLAVSVSFAPNILDHERLSTIQTPELLLNNTGDPVNGHLLDVVEFNDKASDHPLLAEGVLKILDRYNITSKVALVTIDQLSHKLGIHDSLMNALNCNPDSVVKKYLGNVGLARCINSGLEVQFERVAQDLLRDEDFQHEYQKIEKLAESWNNIPGLKSFADELVSPPRFSSQVNEARSVWRQVTKFLRVQQQLKDWLDNAEHDAEASILNELSANISHTTRALELFRYYVECCSVFDKLRGSMLTDGICYLPEGVFISYKLNQFYDLCESAQNGEFIHNEEFAYLNGSDSLLPEHKQRVLKAVLASKKMFKGFFDGVTENLTFYVSVALDPSSRFENLRQFISEDELNGIIGKVEVSIQEYLSKCDLYDHSTTKSGGQMANQTSKRKRLGEGPSETGVFSSSYDEWTHYKNETKILSRSRRSILQWWYDRRAKYPHLFRLAVALLYTQISSNETENIFYVTEHTLKVYQRSVGRINTQKVMLLRNRFKNFGLYNQALRFVNPSID
ncbi:putative transposase of the Rover5 hAT-like family [Lachancea dasiensis]|uniref:Putative transposase of the Rover5 hAT-like family n=1 Tax=Lachancea dasiensis TaxID=1072105 RepID=A0A1G4JKV6_9SACH|nr:putative transposase of the Rover5 hAT-like family [Lachancea dasiensis]